MQYAIYKRRFSKFAIPEVVKMDGVPLLFYRMAEAKRAAKAMGVGYVAKKYSTNSTGDSAT